MASVNWSKHTTSAGGAMIAHADRHEDRDVEYSNKDVNIGQVSKNRIVTISDDNSKIQISAWGERERGSDTYERMKQRIAEIDERQPPKRIREDRKTIVGFTLTPPENLPVNQYGKFFMNAYAAIAELCGGRENVSPGYVHVDEVHQYRDPKTKEMRMSLPHLHVYGIPYTPEHGINCKHFATREHMIQLNKTIDNGTRELCNGIGFMTGERTKGESVEYLKQKSALADVQTKVDEISAAVDTFRQHQEQVRERMPDMRSTFGGTKILRPIEEVRLDYESMAYFDANLTAERNLRAQERYMRSQAEKRADEATERAESISWDKDNEIYRLEAELHNANLKIERLETKLREHGIEPDEPAKIHHRVR